MNCFPSKDLSQQASHTIHVGVIKDKEAILDEVVIQFIKIHDHIPVKMWWK
jgi:tRNA modification GTPase